MKTCRELYEELEYRENTPAKSWAGSMARVGRISQIKTEISQHIDVVKHKDAILKMLESSH